MYTRYWIAIYATIFAIIFTALTYIMPNYAIMWLSIEVIVLPLIYYIGYEVLMNKQKANFEKSINKISNNSITLEKENKLLKEELKKYRKYKKKENKVLY
ncbi:hypothetical protein HY636_03825 [Candidatus Woesearchaeota archaeon]|nr:hypothetical protein [Candidatus Woesearchaeota archaeon]